MDKAFVLKALQEGELDLQGQFVNSSNHTFLTRLYFEDHTLSVVYKPVRGETPLWDFPVGTLAKREVAAYQVSEALGWRLVPATVFRIDAPLGPGSIQLFIDHNPQYHYFNFNEKDLQRLRPVVVFDVLVNNADRKGGHILLDAEKDRLFLIDHGICFNAQDKLRTVVWDFAGEPIPEEIAADVRQFKLALAQKEEIYRRLFKFLNSEELSALVERASKLLEEGHFPHPDPTRRPFPWPPI